MNSHQQTQEYIKGKSPFLLHRKRVKVMIFSVCKPVSAERDCKNASVLFFVGPSQKGSQAFLTETLETGNKNREDFHCMQMSLVMSMRFIFGDD